MTFERDLQDERSGFAAEPASDASSTLIAFGGVRGGMGITVGEAAVALDAVVGGSATRVVTMGEVALHGGA